MQAGHVPRYHPYTLTDLQRRWLSVPFAGWELFFDCSMQVHYCQEPRLAACMVTSINRALSIFLVNPPSHVHFPECAGRVQWVVIIDK